jgi:dihydroorotate dehydrogenase (NAD+) catalytic subunit
VRGSLPVADRKLVSGRLYGPAIFPLALSATALLAEQGIQVIAAGGVSTQEQGQAMLDAGAMAVQIDVGLWK